MMKRGTLPYAIVTVLIASVVLVAAKVILNYTAGMNRIGAGEAVSAPASNWSIEVYGLVVLVFVAGVGFTGFVLYSIYDLMSPGRLG